MLHSTHEFGISNFLLEPAIERCQFFNHSIYKCQFSFSCFDILVHKYDYSLNLFGAAIHSTHEFGISYFVFGVPYSVYTIPVCR